MSQTTAESMVAHYLGLIKELGGLKTAIIDGQTLSLVDLEAKLTFWEARVAKEAGTRPKAAQIDLSGGW